MIIAMILQPQVRRSPGFDTLMTWLGLVAILLIASGMAVWFAPQTIARTVTASDIDRFAPGLQSLETDAAVSFRWTDGAEPLSFVGLSPGVMSGDAPHAMRSIGALAPAYALVAVGLDRLIRTWRYSAQRPLQVLAAAILGITIWNTALYFGTVADQQIMFPKTYTAETLLARVASHVPGRYRIYFSSDMARQDVTRFLTSGLAIGEFDGQRFSPALDGPALILLPDGADNTLGKQVLVALGPQGRLLATGPAIPDGTHPLYTIYGIGADAAQVVNQLSLPR